MPFPLAPHHVQLVAACYPPSAALLTSAPDYKPNSQELSRLTYYASNRPGKIAKLSNELEKRTHADARKAKSGNTRARASLLITLNIFKALTTECRRDLSLLSASLMSALDCTLASLPSDLEAVAKAASVFTAWTTYTNGQMLGVDQNLTRDYVSTMQRFSTMCLVEAKSNDLEDRNRTRLIGLGALTGAVASEALYNSSSQFKSQISVIVPALLLDLLQTDILVLEHESESSKDQPLPLTSYLSDFRSRPLLERRAASIHVHIDGVEGPSMGDVANVALKAFACIFNQSSGSQVGHVMQAVFDSLDMHGGWKDVTHCCWFVQKAVEWTQYQYRFAVPTRLVERLMAAQDDPSLSNVNRALTAMIKTVFTAPLPLVNLSTSDVCSSLTASILRKVAINPHDDLLPELIECVGALGTHIYYADQIHDLACEIIGRLINVESNGLGGKGREYGRKDEKRAVALRCLIAALGSLIQTSTKSLHPSATVDSHAVGPLHTFGSTPVAVPEVIRASSPGSSDYHPVRESLPQRSKISSDVWQETLTLLCDENFAVRSDYAKVLVLYLKSEIGPESAARIVSGAMFETGGTKHARLGKDGSLQPSSNRHYAIGDSGIDRFLHALIASLYVLATSPKLGLPPTSPPSPAHSSDAGQEHDHEREHDSVHVNITPSTPLQDQTFSSVQDESSPDLYKGSQSSRRQSMTLAQSRKLYRIRWLLDAANRKLSLSRTDSDASPACLSDYLHVLDILNVLHERTPLRALLTVLPMLLSLRLWCESECSSQLRQAAIRQVLISQWEAISRVWDCIGLSNEPPNTPLGFPPSYSHPETIFPLAEEAQDLSALAGREDEETQPWDEQAAIAAIAGNSNVQLATGLDETGLKKRFETQWTPENALRDSIEQLANGDMSRQEHSNPLLKISPALMHISNLSLQSLTRSNRGVGVNDLREVLEGRSGTSNLALSQGRAPSVASLGVTHSGASGESAIGYPGVMGAHRPKMRMLDGENPREVRDVLDKLGIGAQSGTSLRKTSLSARQPSGTRSVLIPPYKG
ncbi:hypothetical protein M0805_006130 [Coniferiporia weirii]|nr:hypothetical protein M0805_006130 [Coniferiporia weirii]